MPLSSLPITKLALSPPPLSDLATAIAAGLRTNFTTSTVSVSTPPDLRNAPFFLAGPGLSGNARVADIGGVQNLRPTPNLDAKYDLLGIARLMGMSDEGGLLVGAGAGPFHHLGYNSELMPNIAYGSASDGVINNCTHYAKITQDGGVRCEKIGESVGFALMANLFGCDGETGPILHVTARGRKARQSFTESIRAGIRAVYGDKLVSLGGVFVIHKGKTKLHVMPDFSDKPLRSPDDLDGWLRYFDTDPPLVCLSVFHSGDDGDLGLRMEHTHCFAGEGGAVDCRGGHYHGDVDETMQDVEYEAWFNVGEVLYRIGQPDGE
ncbi:hypothetical protein AK830_g8244 [Neonectria ditissima]|uniref:DUF1907 domain-containing protein n=1 Tax=Neonectria ditissima TaxID=78410 RepID=A0A0P7B8H3_9HYPO|nr:hypothetical protein AK830_g8244 [Neonectria ditissima]